jgi:hypothetical protein
MQKHNLSVNKKLIVSLLTYNGMTMKGLGELCDPPVSKMTISLFLRGTYDGNNERLAQQTAEILRPTIPAFVHEVSSLRADDPFHILFPDSVYQEINYE